jgi:yersiniabactin nonribosomal peptide synthetase
VYRILSELPRMTSGKVSREALHALVADEDRGARRPSTEREARVMALWSRILGRPIEDVEADLIALGAQSLDVIRFVALAQEEMSMTIPSAVILQRPTVAAIAAWTELPAAPGPDAAAGDIDGVLEEDEDLLRSVETLTPEEVQEELARVARGRAPTQ